MKNYFPEAEGRLYSWADSLKKDRPGAPISALYRLLDQHGKTPIRQTHRQPSSPQEAWAAKNHDIISNAAAVEKALKRMSKKDRTVAFMRYVLGHSWRQIGAFVGENEWDVRGRIRERVLRTVADEFGLVDEEEAG